MILCRTYRQIGLLLAILFSTLASFSQDSYQEQIFVHLDRNYYLSGEQIRFAIYCMEKGSGKPARASALANIELLNQEGRVIRKGKIKLADGVGSGVFDIPSDIDSEEHIIRCYTSWMRNFGPQHYYYNSILIIHPSEHYDPLIVSRSPDETEYSAGVADNVQIRAVGLKETYAARDSISFSLETQTPPGDASPASLSVSITMSENYNAGASSNSMRPVPAPLPGDAGVDQPLTMKYLPDMEGLQLTGVVLQMISGKPVANEHVILSFIDSITEILSVKTDLEGRFRFDLNGLKGEKDMIIQTFHGNGDVLITIDPDFSREAIPEFARVSLEKENLDGLFTEMILNQQLISAYAQQKTYDSAGSPGLPALKQDLPFYGRHDHRIVMEEFIKLPVMEEVLRELGKRIYLVREQGKYKVSILDLNTNRIIGDRPYYFLDGVPFFESQKLLDLDPGQIKSISLKSEKYFVGDLVMDGIVDIRSRKGDASLIDFPRSAIRQYFQAFSEEVPAPASLPRDDPHIPLFQTTLFFDPLVEMEPDLATTIGLIAPDATGTYDIVIRGLDHEGRIMDQEFSFVVE